MFWHIPVANVFQCFSIQMLFWVSCYRLDKKNMRLSITDAGRVHHWRKKFTAQYKALPVHEIKFGCHSYKPNGVWQHLRRCHDMSLPNTRFWKWSNGVKRVERDLFWCISMTNNVKSCKKINGRAQTSRFSVFTRGRKELWAENAKNCKNYEN